MKQSLKKKYQKLLKCLRYEFSVNSFDIQKQLINGLSETDITIFDVGANRGQSAERYRLLFPNAEIYCFEPFPDSITILKKKFSEDAKIHIVPKAVSNKIGILHFFVNEYDPTNSLLPRPTSGRRYYPNKAGPKDTIFVEAITLDKFIADINIQAVDILKLDIQGGELLALCGANNLLQKGTGPLIYTEIMFVPHYEGSPLFHDIWSFLVGYGYSLFDIFNISRATNGQIRFGDAIFVSEILRNSVIDRYPDEP